MDLFFHFLQQHFPGSTFSFFSLQNINKATFEAVSAAAAKSKFLARGQQNSSFPVIFTGRQFGNYFVTRLGPEVTPVDESEVSLLFKWGDTFRRGLSNLIGHRECHARQSRV